ncbi:MAG: NADH-quinone oxidoreductase subunit F, partial [Planctomycetota bacterium]|nr:NADH-quinone oxidoreductase subunit F [Planctomycetota bacterium]
MIIKTLDNLKMVQQKGLASLYPQQGKISVSTATCGLATGAGEILKSIQEETNNSKADIIVSRTGCIGFCQVEPIVLVYHPAGPIIVYKEMTSEKARELVQETLQGRIKTEGTLCKIVNNGNYKPTSSSELLTQANTIPAYGDIPFYKKQLKIALRNCGFIDPDNIEEYIARGGYFALYKTFREMSPDEVIAEVKISGLRGRGGAGFPTGVKWEFCRKAQGNEKFVICNADEGDPGAYMDRSVLEGDPHSVIEGMLIGAYAIGASSGYIYVRDEYPQAIEKFRKAIEQAR